VSTFVSSILVIENCRLQKNIGLPLIANGYPCIVFQTAGSGPVLNGDKKMDSLMLYGQIIKPLALYTPDRLTIISYFLHPYMVKAVFGFQATEITDTGIDLSNLKPAKEKNLKEQLGNETSLEKRLQLLNNFILQLYNQAYADTPCGIIYASQMILKNKGLISLPGLQKELQITERTFQRMFESYIGISPRMYSRICRFQAAFRQLNENQFSHLSDIAYEHDYTDHSHLTRTFKEFTGYTPKEYLKNTAEFLQLNEE
jgi:AraC-like DNA-binding protein